MNHLIKMFNTSETHIEIDAVNQFENGTSDNKNKYSYTVLLLKNKSNELVHSVSIDEFSANDVLFVTHEFNRFIEMVI